MSGASTEGVIFAMVIVVWFFSFFLGNDKDVATWVMRGFLTVAAFLMFLEVTSIIDIIPLNSGTSK
jgi:uncharacterized membrane protein YobD (UPF0266 family)